MHWIKHLAAKSGLVLLSVLATLMLLEVALRFSSYRHILQEPILSRLPAGYMRSDPIKAHDVQENLRGTFRFSDWDCEQKHDIWSNEMGCFDRPYQGEKEYILLVGDSFTHAYAPFADKWGTVVEELLGYRVLKCGVIGYGTTQELLKAKEIISKIGHPPRLIVVGYFHNDLEDDYRFRGLEKTPPAGGTSVVASPEPAAESRVANAQLMPGPLTDFKAWLMQHSIAYMIIVQRIKSLAYHSPMLRKVLEGSGVTSHYGGHEMAFMDPSLTGPAWATHFQTLKAFEELTARTGARPLFVIIPCKEQVYPFLVKWDGIDPEGPNKRLRAFFEKEGIAYIDLLTPFRAHADPTPRQSLNRERDLYWRYDGHLNVKGNHLAGLMVSQYIAEHDLVELPDKERALRHINQRLKSFR